MTDSLKSMMTQGKNVSTSMAAVRCTDEVRHRIACLGLCAVAASAATWSALACENDGSALEPVADLVAWDGGPGNQFGYAVNVSGDVAVVGANQDNDLGSNSGSAYIFRFDGSSWVQEQKILASDGETGDMFGLDVDISGDVLVVGAPRDDDAAGTAGAMYIFRYDGESWVEEQKIVPFDGESWDAFGSKVGISGNRVITGSMDDDAGYNAGAVYLYRFNGDEWVFEDKFVGSDTTPNDYFGADVSIDGPVAMVGAYGDESAYIFRRVSGEWIEEAKLVADDGGTHDEFGRAVDLDGPLAVVGSRNHNNSGTGLLDGHGAAYVYRFAGGNWGFDTKLEDENGAAWDKLGHAVAVSGSLVVLGAPWDDDGNTNSGSAMVFGFDGLDWAQDNQLLNSSGGYSDLFGSSVAIWNDVAVVGSFQDDDNGTSSGSARIFSGAGGAASNNQGDANGDGLVDVNDMVAVMLAIFVPCGEICPEDLNCDDLVDVDDLLLVLTNWD
jgi:hypothetical protein